MLAASKVLLDKSGEGNDFLGWLDLPTNYDKEEFARIRKAAQKIRRDSDVLVVIGIGGSYLGARAVIELLGHSFANAASKKVRKSPLILFCGNSISATYLADMMDIIEGKDISLNIISKSGTTTEPAVAFRVFRALLEKKYGVEGARERIFVTTDKARGTLKKFSDEKGYQTFVVPDDVGGRFSVLTPVGLLPLAVGGVDIEALVAGAAAMEAAKGSNIVIGAENVHFAAKGAYTGEVSAEMLKAIGVDTVIIGHSERRQYFGETDETVNKRMQAALANGPAEVMGVDELPKKRV